MENVLKEIRDKQKNIWNQCSPGWEKWDALLMDFLAPMGNVMIEYIQPLEQKLILDIASGTGEPALTIASLLHKGHIVMTDLSEDMLAIAKAKATSLSLQNVDTKVCDVTELPFADNTFDAVTCRFGFMFFPDMRLAAREMIRVLKPGGKLVAAVWGLPEKNIWISAVTHVIQQHLQLPETPVDAPGMFRCAKSGLLQHIFEEAQLKNVFEREVTNQLHFDTAEAYWDMMKDISAPIEKVFKTADSITKNAIKSSTIQIIEQHFGKVNLAIDASALVIGGEK